MNDTTVRPTDNVSPSIFAQAARFSLEKIRDPRLADAVADALETIDRLKAIADGFPRLAPPTPRFFGDGVEDDFEVTAEDEPTEWPAWTDRSRWTTSDPTPIEVLAAHFELPALSGGSPEAEPFEPSVEDWEDYHAWADAIDDGRFNEADARAAGLAV